MYTEPYWFKVPWRIKNKSCVKKYIVSYTYYDKRWSEYKIILVTNACDDMVILIIMLWWVGIHPWYSLYLYYSDNLVLDVMC